MKALGYSIGATLTSVVMVAAFAMPAGADSISDSYNNNTLTNTETNTVTVTKTTDNTTTITDTTTLTNSGIQQNGGGSEEEEYGGGSQTAVQGDGSGVFKVFIGQSQETKQKNVNVNLVGEQANVSSVDGNSAGGYIDDVEDDDNEITQNSTQENTQTNTNTQSIDQSNSNSQVLTVSQTATGVIFN